MITYNWKGEPVDSPRDILGELCTKHDQSYVDEAIRAEGYNHPLLIGDPEVAEVQIFFSTQEDTEFAAIAMISLGDDIQGYVFRQHYDALMFLKEYSPMIESILNIRASTNNGE